MTRPAIYTRPAKPLTIPVRARTEPPKLAPAALAAPLAVDRATECHVTPQAVAARMAAYLGPPGILPALEPQAGTGQLVRALLAAGYDRGKIVMIERHHALAAALADLGPVCHTCFLDYAEEARGRVYFDRVIMNPPFSTVRQHMRAALSLLFPDRAACLVALVPVTFDHPGAETLETLPPDTFATAKVYTKIIRIKR